tara:strand:+ start:3598 stop:3999 length:402 start_codon:yes stop_codon:yes gene_type:complete
MKPRKYKKYGGQANQDKKADERTEEELIVVDLLESLNYNFKKYKYLFDLNNSTSGCPDKLLKIILGEIDDEDNNAEKKRLEGINREEKIEIQAGKLAGEISGKNNNNNNNNGGGRKRRKKTRKNRFCNKKKYP